MPSKLPSTTPGGADLIRGQEPSPECSVLLEPSSGFRRPMLSFAHLPDSFVGLPTPSSSGSLARLAVGDGTLYLPFRRDESFGFNPGPLRHSAFSGPARIYADKP